MRLLASAFSFSFADIGILMAAKIIAAISKIVATMTMILYIFGIALILCLKAAFFWLRLASSRFFSAALIAAFLRASAPSTLTKYSVFSFLPMSFESKNCSFEFSLMLIL